MPRNPKIPTTSRGLNVNPNMLTTLETLQLRRQLAKRLNQRMRRLKAKGFDSEVGGAYADYQDWSVAYHEVFKEKKFYKATQKVSDRCKIIR
mgnify:CR=1 FL=1|jgi:hypothetical protein